MAQDGRHRTDGIGRPSFYERALTLCRFHRLGTQTFHRFRGSFDRQLPGDPKCPVSGVTTKFYGRVWRKDAGKRWYRKGMVPASDDTGKGMVPESDA